MPSVHFKFKSQKDAQRVTFDGTDINVFDLKHEIIKIMNLGDGQDFDLALYRDDRDEEYTDDLERIPQSSLVLARRLPAKIPGRGTAARYASGKAPVNARPVANTAPAKKSSKTIDINNAQTEEEKTAAILSMNDEQWKQKQQEMANETRVPIVSGRPFQKKANVPEGEPPHGYICYRCGKKGHWIQACPTNDDPNFEGRVRVKRTTGIPRSMLKTIDQSELDQLDEAQRQNMMMDSDGKYVLAKVDEKEWAKHLEKVNASAAAQVKAGYGDKELESRGLECPIDKRLFVDPMKTPCCGKTYCNECITNALIDSDLTCPGCDTENIILEQLEADKEMQKKIKEYEAEKAAQKKKEEEAEDKKAEQSPSLKSQNATLDKVDAAAAPPSPAASQHSSNSSTADGGVKSKKRSASEANEDGKLKIEGVGSPAMKRQKSEEQQTPQKDNKTDISGEQTPSSPTENVVASSSDVPVGQFMPPDMMTMMQNMQNSMPNMMGFPGMMPNMGMPGMPGMPGMMPFMPMPGLMNMPMNMNMDMSMPMNPSMMPGGFMPTPNFNPMAGMAPFAPNQPQQSFGNMFSNPQASFSNNSSTNNAPNAMQPNGLNGVPTGPRLQQNNNAGFTKFPPAGPAAMVGNNSNNMNKFSNQQRHVGKEEDNAYMRQPVNPHRHQNRGKRVRPSDYREL